MSEIYYSHSINGENIYNYNDINSLLNNCDKSFNNENEYIQFLANLEQQYEKNGVAKEDYRIKKEEIKKKQKKKKK